MNINIFRLTTWQWCTKNWKVFFLLCIFEKFRILMTTLSKVDNNNIFKNVKTICRSYIFRPPKRRCHVNKWPKRINSFPFLFENFALCNVQSEVFHLLKLIPSLQSLGRWSWPVNKKLGCVWWAQNDINKYCDSIWINCRKQWQRPRKRRKISASTVNRRSCTQYPLWRLLWFDWFFLQETLRY